MRIGNAGGDVGKVESEDASEGERSASDGGRERRRRRYRRSASASASERRRRLGNRSERFERGSRWDLGAREREETQGDGSNAVKAGVVAREVVRAGDVEAKALNKQIEMMRALSSTAKETADKAIEAARAKAAELMEATVGRGTRAPAAEAAVAEAATTPATTKRAVEAETPSAGDEEIKKVTYLTDFYPIDVRNEGLIIGPSGATIRKLQQEIGTDIQVMRGEGRLQIKGSREKIDFAKASLDEFMRTKGPRTVRVSCKARSGLIIGNAGQTIKALKEQTSCRIEVMRDVEEVVITGPGERVDVAKTIVEKMIADSWVEGADHGSLTIIEEVVPCAYKAGAIIGPGGNTIRQLRETTGVSIDIERGANGCKAGDQCRLIGTPAQVKKALELVHQLLEEMNQANMSAAPAVPPMYAYTYGVPYGAAPNSMYDPNMMYAAAAPVMDPATYAAWQAYYAQLGAPAYDADADAAAGRFYPPQP